MCIFCERAQLELAGGLTTAQKREAEQCPKLRERRIRATILTGFLGAGKTTFLNFVLKSLSHGKRIAVVQNEFGYVPVDDQLMLVERSEAEVITMPNGCLCCRVRGDMVEALQRLAKRPQALGEADSGPALDHLLIECSGLSEVVPVAQTFFADPFVQASFHLDGVVCVCDAAHFEAMEGGGVLPPAEGASQAPGSAGADVQLLLREQLSISDVCLLNKCDLVDSSQRDRIAKRLRALNPAVKVVPCRHGKVNLGQVMQLNSFSLESALSLDAHFLDGDDDGTGDGHGHGHGHGNGHGHGHDHEHAHNAFGSLGLEEAAPLDLEQLKAWLRTVVEKHGERLIRIKGVVRTAGSGEMPPGVAIVQGVGGHIEVNDAPAGMPTPAASTPSRLVFIGKMLGFGLAAELRAGFKATAQKAAPA